jgi:hypothetical protein
MSPFETAALDYAARQWSTMPLLSKGKTPLVEWTKWQQQRATARQIEAWARTWRYANVGIITGAISNLVVVDLDGVEGLAALHKFPETARVRTAHGLHLYFGHPGGLVPNSVKTVLPGVDIRGDAGYVVAPPSIHETGVVYAWIRPERPLAGLPVLPAWVVESRVEARQEKAGPTTPAAAGAEAAPTGYLIPKGQRWDTLWKLGRSRRQLGASRETIDAMLRTENFERCDPPLDEAELRRLIREVIERPDRAR